MQTKRTVGPTGSSPAEAVPDGASSRGRIRARSPHARLLSVLRGDKYMVNAYPPAWRSPAGAAEAHLRDGDNGGVQ
jgi:hypothetical protein